MQPFVMNFILYSTYMYEVLMVVTSFLAWTLPCFLMIGLCLTRKPDFVRALIVYLAAKISFTLFNEHRAYYFTNEKFFLCPIFGNGLTENKGLCEQSFLVSMFFTYLVLSTLMSMNNFLCKDII